MAPLAVQLGPGVEAHVQLLDGDRVELTTPQPSAPGTRLGARLGDGRELRLKVLRCVRRGDGYAVEARLFDASRELRRALAAMLARTSPSPDGGSSTREG